MRSIAVDLGPVLGGRYAGRAHDHYRAPARIYYYYNSKRMPLAARGFEEQNGVNESRT